MVGDGPLVGLLLADTGSFVGENNIELAVVAVAGFVTFLGLRLWRRIRHGSIRTHAIYRAWIPFEHRDGDGVAGKHGRPVLVLESLGDGTILVLEGTSKSSGHGARVNIGTGSWSSRRDIATGRVTYLRTDRCLRIRRDFIDRSSGPHRISRRLLAQACRVERPPVEERLTPPNT